MPNLKFNYLNVLDFFIVLCTILDTHSIFKVSVTREYHILMFLLLFLTIKALLTIPVYFKAVKKKLVVSISLWLFYVTIFATISGYGRMDFVLRFVILPILFMLYFDYLVAFGQLGRVLKLYIKIIKWIMGISLFFWIFGSLLRIVSPNGTMLIQWGKLVSVSSYFGVYFQWHNDAFFLGKQFFRNIGIFAEAPMYSLHICLAYLLEFYILRKSSLKNLVFYGVTVLSTYSITGILLIVISQVMSITFSNFSNSLKNRKSKVYLLLLPAVIIAGIVLGYDLLTSKLESASGGSRIEDYVIGYKAWKVHPWFGSGYGDISLINSFKSMLRFSRSATGYTNSLMYVLTEGGVYFMLSFALGLLHYIIKSFTIKNSQLFIFASMIIFLFLTTTFQHTALIIAIISFAFIDKLGDFGIISNEKV